MAKQAKGKRTTMSDASASSGLQTLGQTNDAVDLLSRDHRTVEDLFQKYSAAGSTEEKSELAKKICTELTIHTMLEEELFYPACREMNVQHESLDEAQVEHDGAKILIRDIQGESPEDMYYDAKVTVLAQYIKHHVAEEEKAGDGIFAKAKAAGVDMQALGQRLQKRKQELQVTAKAPQLLSLRIRSLHRENQQEETMNRQSNDRNRDEYGRFEPDRNYSSRGRDDDQEDYGGRGRSSGGSGRGWYGDPEGHSRAAEERWYGQSRGSQGGYRSRRDQDDDGGRESRGGGGGGGGGSGSGRGWYGDPEGHSRASEEGWESRGRGSEGSSSRSGRDDDDDRSRGGSSGRGWYGDPEGHSRASEEGWESRGRSSRGSSSRSSRDDDDDRSRGRGHGGWFGDPEGHAEAARQRSR